MTKAFGFCLVLLLTVTARAMDDTPENRILQAERYLQAVPPGELLQSMTKQSIDMMPLDQQAIYKDMLTKHLDVEAIAQIMKNALSKNFSADELKALADFYGSPVGKSAMKKFSAYMRDSAPAIQTEVSKAFAKAQQAAAAAAMAPPTAEKK
jgi:hypothetical protein